MLPLRAKRTVQNMGIPFFQQQSAAYNTHQKCKLHVFTPDGRRYLVDVGGKSYAEYAEEVQEYLVPFEMEALLAQRDSLRAALTRRYLIQHFGLAGDAHFAGMDLDDLAAELELRGITPGAIKSALRSTVTRVAGELKESWPIRESGRNLQYTSYAIVFAATEANTPTKRQKIWDTVAAWARASALPGKEGARLATVQDWDELNEGHAIRVDLHHYPRPNLDSCRAIALLDAAERNKDMDVLRKTLARLSVELGDIAVKPFAAAHHSSAHGTPQHAAAPVAEPAPAIPSPPPSETPRPEPTLADTLDAVRSERERLDQQLRLLSDALTDHEERQRQAQRIESLEQEKAGLGVLLRDIATPLDNLAWPGKPSDWPRFPPVEKARHILAAFKHALAALDQSEKSLRIAKSELHTLTGRAQGAETQRDQLATELGVALKSRDQWRERAESFESNLRGELQKQHEAALLAQEIDFARQIQGMQQERMRDNQQLRDEHLREMEALQDSHLKQIQKLRRLVPAQNILHVEEESGDFPPPAIAPAHPPAAAELGRYQAESQEIFDNRIGEYLRIAKDQGLAQADQWLLAEAKKLAEARAHQGELSI